MLCRIASRFRRSDVKSSVLSDGASSCTNVAPRSILCSSLEGLRVEVAIAVAAAVAVVDCRDELCGWLRSMLVLSASSPGVPLANLLMTSDERRTFLAPVG